MILQVPLQNQSHPALTMTNPNTSQNLYWFRPSPFPRIIAISILCGLCMMVGVIVVGAGLDGSGRVASQYQGGLLISGMMIVLSSVFSACWGYYKTMIQDTSILILTQEGLIYTSPEQNLSLPWKTLEDVESTNRSIIIKTSEQEYCLQDSFLGITNIKLRILIIETQKKVLLGAL